MSPAVGDERAGKHPYLLDEEGTMIAVNTLAPGARGEPVRDVQARLAALGYLIDTEEHGAFGPSMERAVREFQQRRGLLVDGLVGAETWGELVEAGYSVGDRMLYLRFPFIRGDDVRAIQAGLNLLGFDAGREDGIFGQRTDRAVRDFQRNVGLPSDGIVGSTTVEAIGRLRPVGPGPGRAAVREAEILSRLSASLEGARIALDAGHGSDDVGALGPTGTTEADLTRLLAEALAEELSVRGAIPVPLRSPGSDPSALERAAAANELGAEAVLSIHLNSHEDSSAEGASTFYYGREGWESQAGRRLAELIQDELTERLRRKDGRTHPLSLPLLRETRMPAVHVEPCFITNPNEEQLLCTEEFRRDVARAIADGVERFFGRGHRASTASSTPASRASRPS
jgi:N-acetylmuramoyl-L-alanine amidase